MAIEIDEVIEEIVRVLVEKCHPEKIILFGSCASGSWTPDSDIDLLIIKDAAEENKVDRFVEIKRMIYNPKLKIPVSPLVLTRAELKQRVNMGDDFINQIVTLGKVIYER